MRRCREERKVESSEICLANRPGGCYVQVFCDRMTSKSVMVDSSEVAMSGTVLYQERSLYIPLA